MKVGSKVEMLTAFVKVRIRTAGLYWKENSISAVGSESGMMSPISPEFAGTSEELMVARSCTNLASSERNDCSFEAPTTKHEEGINDRLVELNVHNFSSPPSFHISSSWQP